MIDHPWSSVLLFKNGAKPHPGSGPKWHWALALQFREGSAFFKWCFIFQLIPRTDILAHMYSMYSCILSDINSDILSDTNSDILSDKNIWHSSWLKNVAFDLTSFWHMFIILLHSGVLSRIKPGTYLTFYLAQNLTGFLTSYLAKNVALYLKMQKQRNFWYMLWHLIWPNMFWQIFWHSICNVVWHSIWKSNNICLTSNESNLTFYLTSILAFTLSF